MKLDSVVMSMYAKASRPLGLACVFLLALTSWAVTPFECSVLWASHTALLINEPFTAKATMAVKIVLSATVGFILVFIYSGGLIRRRRYLIKAPFKDILYKKIAVQIGTSFGMVATAGMGVLSLIAPLWWTLIFLWTFFAFVVLWRREATYDCDRVSMIAAKRYGRSSAEANAVRYSQMLRSSIMAALLVTELFAFLMWQSSGHSIGAMVRVLGIYCILGTIFMWVLYGTGYRTAKRVLADLKKAGLLEQLERRE